MPRQMTVAELRRSLDHAHPDAEVFLQVGYEGERVPVMQTNFFYAQTPGTITLSNVNISKTSKLRDFGEKT